MTQKKISSGVVHNTPSDLRQTLLSNPGVLEKWEGITSLARNEWICWIEDAKKGDTRLRRIKRLCEDLLDGKKRPCCWAGCPHRKIPPLYKQYFIDKSDERKIMFEKISILFNPQKGLYPGSFVHITPSFYISDMTYVDSDKRISSFFKDERVTAYINCNKTYDKTCTFRGFQSDYSEDLPIEKNSFDIMFSFYAGFISQVCKRYLMKNGILVCNNSHGDASLASIDKDYELVGVIKREGEKFRISDKDLPSYFLKKDGSPVNKEKVERRMIGENFTKKAYAYIFRYNNGLNRKE